MFQCGMLGNRNTSGALSYLPGSSLSPVCVNLLTAGFFFFACGVRSKLVEREYSRISKTAQWNEISDALNLFSFIHVMFWAVDKSG
jgi:hypothetical protein